MHTLLHSRLPLNVWRLPAGAWDTAAANVHTGPVLTSTREDVGHMSIIHFRFSHNLLNLCLSISSFRSLLNASFYMRSSQQIASHARDCSPEKTVSSRKGQGSNLNLSRDQTVQMTRSRTGPTARTTQSLTSRDVRCGANAFAPR